MAEIKIFKFFSKKYCLKKIDIPLSYKELKSQHKFIKYLIKQRISTAYISNLFLTNMFKCEIQEFIDGDDDFIVENLVLAIALFHSKSSVYRKKFYKKNIYNFEYNCNGHSLKHLLLGFDEKYYKYPIENFCKIYQNNLIDENNNLLLKYKFIFNHFKDKFYNKTVCIIHNDITPKNVIFKNGMAFLIDFDLSIYSTAYVDFVDSIVSRKNNLKEVYIFMKNKEIILKLIDIYNKNSKLKLSYLGVLEMICLKIFAYNCYVKLDINYQKNFIKDLEQIQRIINYVEEMIRND